MKQKNQIKKLEFLLKLVCCLVICCLTLAFICHNTEQTITVISYISASVCATIAVLLYNKITETSNKK